MSEIKESSHILMKHSAAVHISGDLSLLERKIYNVLLKNAYSNLLKKSEHTISTKDIAIECGWNLKTNQNEGLKKALMSLNRSQVTWNILGKDKKNLWGVSTLLSSIEIYNGRVTYRYDEKLRSLFAKPSIYAKLNLQVHQKFKSKYAYALWEYFVEILSSKNINSLKNHYFPLIELRSFLSLETKYKVYKDLKSVVIEPALKEINNVSDITLSYSAKRSGRSISTLVFDVATKKNFQMELDWDDAKDAENKNLTIKLKGYGLSDKVIKKYVKEYDINNLNKAIYITDERMLKDNLDNPAAYFTKALIEEWEPQISKEKSRSKNLPILDETFENQIKNEDWKLVRKTFIKKNGLATFNSWIKELSIESIAREQVTLKANTNFKRDYIEREFLKDLTAFWNDVKGIKTRVIIK